jgi:hypothetical protein
VRTIGSWRIHGREGQPTITRETLDSCARTPAKQAISLELARLVGWSLVAPGLRGRLGRLRDADREWAVTRRPANITQADVARAIRAAKQAGAAEIEVHVGDRSTSDILDPPRLGALIKF